MRVFGHYVLGSRVRLFFAEQAAVGVLFLAAAASRGYGGALALVLAASSALALQLALYLVDLYEPFETFPETRWLLAAGGGVVLATLLRIPGGASPAGVGLAATGLSLVILVLLRELALTRPRRAVVLGSGPLARAVAETREALVDCEVVGYLADQHVDDGGPTPLPLLLDRGDVDAVSARMSADLIVVATEAPLPVEALARARAAGVEVTSPAGFTARYARRVPPELMANAELVFGEGFRATALTDAVQRGLDVVVALLLLGLSAPALLLSMLAIRLDSPGSVFYTQERIGRHGRIYRITKLRSMRVDAEVAGQPRWAAKNDDRVTRVGRFLRKTRLDELPQVFSVLRGDMSMVGPRPERPYFVHQLKEQVPFYGLREAVRPGVTGWAQIRYRYGATVEDARRKLEYDLYYIQHRSIFLNLAIMFHTARTVLTGRGAQ